MLSCAAFLTLPAGWESHRAADLRILSRQRDAPLAASLAREGPAIRSRIAQQLGLDRGPSIPDTIVVLIPRGASGRGVEAPEAPEWAAGFTVPGSRVLYLRVGSLGRYPHRDVLSVFAHELAHADLELLAGSTVLPRWFEEGTCMVLARPWDLRDSLSLTAALFFQPPQPLVLLEKGFPSDEAAARAAYAQSFSFVSWLAERGGGAASLAAVAREAGAGFPFVSAFSARFGRTPEQAAAVWRGSVARWYRLVPLVTGATAFWVLVTLLFLMVVIRKRRSARETVKRWEQEEGGTALPPGPSMPS